MTPKEKAEELVEKYSIFAWNENLFDSDVAKKCALMVVDEIIAICCYWDTVEKQEFWKLFWGKVKTEIESL
jgi:hypothetical protein